MIVEIFFKISAVFILMFVLIGVTKILLIKLKLF